MEDEDDRSNYVVLFNLALSYVIAQHLVTSHVVFCYLALPGVTASEISDTCNDLVLYHSIRIYSRLCCTIWLYGIHFIVQYAIVLVVMLFYVKLRNSMLYHIIPYYTSVCCSSSGRVRSNYVYCLAKACQ